MSELGVTVWETYSCEEIGNIATSCPNGEALHVVAESVLVELLDDDDQPCEEGAIGRVVVTDLHNFATPLVRYDLGDFAQVVPRCPCGRGLPTIGRVVGREANRLRRPDGTYSWPEPVPLVQLPPTWNPMAPLSWSPEPVPLIDWVARGQRPRPWSCVAHDTPVANGSGCPSTKTVPSAGRATSLTA